MAAMGGYSYGSAVGHDAILRTADLLRMWGGGACYHKQIRSQSLEPRTSEVLSILFVNEDNFFLKGPTLPDSPKGSQDLKYISSI